jgi:adenylosuccinate lyase
VEFKHTPTIGRTHGVHAEPTTFGLKLLLWYAEMGRNLKRFNAAAEDMRVGKLSGAVGAFGKLKPEHEIAILKDLNLVPAPISTQVLQRDRHAAYITTLAVLASSMDKIATEIRHLQRTEVREAEEFFSPGQKGSSAMPHKRNPITCENICGLARVVRGNAQVALENVALWHERDISHSSAERVIFPDTTILIDYMLDKTATLIEKLLVYPARMKKNLESTHGLVFSGQLLVDLAAAGMSREDAYKVVQTHAMDAWQNDLNFRELIENDPLVIQYLGKEKIAEAFEVERQLQNVDAIFARVVEAEV